MKNLLKSFIVVLFTSAIVFTSKAQDIHFSQFFNSPLSLNPAMTGLMKEDVRASILYRSQWKQINSQFKTIAFAGDMNFPLKDNNPNRVGVGIFTYNDKLGGGIITNNSIYVSTAYHKYVGKTKRMKLSGGVQVGFVQKSIDYSTLIFASQYVNYEANPNMSSGEDLSKSGFRYVNFNLGLGGSYKFNEKMDLFTGISFFNLNRPRENFTATLSEEQKNNLKGRFTWTGIGSYKLSKKVCLLPAVLVMVQSKVFDFNAGSSIGYMFNGAKNTMIQAGVEYRNDDAVILLGGLRYNHINLGLSYDITTSSLTQIKKSPTVKDNAKIGAFEVTLTYVAYLKRPLPGQLTVPCKFF